MVVVVIVVVAVVAVAMVAVGAFVDTATNKAASKLCDSSCYIPTNKWYELRITDT